MVARDKAPQSFEDLLDLRWKDKLGMDTTDYDWLASLIDYYGRGKALELAGRLSKQQLNLRRGPTLLVQLAVAGEFPIVIDAFPEEIMQMKNAKAPADFIFSEPSSRLKRRRRFRSRPARRIRTRPRCSWISCFLKQDKI
jgi:ABC-type Fe3+ transport system, periplasmic component